MVEADRLAHLHFLAPTGERFRFRGRVISAVTFGDITRARIIVLSATCGFLEGFCWKRPVLFLRPEATAWEPLSSGFRVEVLPHYPPNNR